MIDTIVEAALIHDGSGSPPFCTDVGVVGERIALIGALEEREAHARIAAGKRVLAPGFIDVAAHTDELWLADGRCSSKIRQGVTTEIGGNCGRSVAPRGSSADSWRDLDEFFTAALAGGVALNIATLVGLGTTRELVAGDSDAPLDAAQQRRQSDLIRQAVEQGALGVSSGLMYRPSRYANPAELVACASAAREAGMPRYVTHLRSEADTLCEAVDEALEIGRRADVAVHFSHHKAAGKKNWGKVDRSLEMIARARAGGLNAFANVYPYVATCTRLDTLLPDDATLGGIDATLERLRDLETAAALALRLQLDRDDAGWHDIQISSVASNRNAGLEGMRLDEIAQRRRISPPRAALELLLEERLDVSALFFNLCEDDVATVLSADFVAIGSAAAARSHNGAAAHGLPHPRTFGCFPRVFGRFVRGRGTLKLGEAIRRMTSLPADAFGIAQRGRIAVGAYADLVLFDPATIADTATYEQPCSYPRGIDDVWVNGRAVVRNGQPTGARPGHIVKGR